MEFCVVGTGPAGLYTVASLLKHFPSSRVTVLERSPTPFGLLRSGVAPDHPEIKGAAGGLSSVFASPAVRYMGHVAVGFDLGLDELRSRFHAVLLATGASRDARLGVPGEDLPGVLGSGDFVGWYNRAPFLDRRDGGARFLGDAPVAVLGVGNVALDVARFLAAPSRFVGSDADPAALAHVLSMPRGSAARAHVIARSPAARARCTPRELRELLRCARVAADPAAHGAGDDGAGLPRPARRVLELFAGLPTSPPPWDVVFHFERRPVRFLAGDDGALDAVELARPDGATETLHVRAAIKCLGFRVAPLPGVPLAEGQRHFAHVEGAIAGVDGVYAAGWCKRGSSGIVGTNRWCAEETVRHLRADLEHADTPAALEGADGVAALLKRRGTRVVSWAEWQNLEAEEERRGALRNVVREKFISAEEAIQFLDSV